MSEETTKKTTKRTIKRLNEYGERLTQREAHSLRSRLGSHARNNCASYGEACPFATCIVEIQTERIAANVCPYFIKHVLPAEPLLEKEYYEALPDDNPLKPERRKQVKGKPCEVCSIEFDPRSNRQKYCDGCADKVRRERDAARKREARYREAIGE